MRYWRTAAFPLIVIGLGLTGGAHARCVNTTTGGQATDGADQPASGQSVVCDTGAPNPSSTTVTSVAGSTGVTITVLPGAIVSTTARAIGLDGNTSSILNQGSILTSGLNAFGLATTSSRNTLTNAGSISTTGARAHGMSATGSNSTLINTGTIVVSGAGASGLRSTETSAGTLLRNSGSITANGGVSAAPAPALTANGVSLTAGTFENLAGGTVTSAQAFGVLGGNGNITVRNAGTITGGNGTGVQLGNGANVFEMTAGQINGAVISGTGTNTLTVSGGLITGNVSTSSGNDTFNMLGGTIQGIVDLGNGNNSATVSAGTLDNGLSTGTGADTLNWSGGAIAGTISLGAGNDTATLSNLTDAQLATTTLADGGAGVDTLTFDKSLITGFSRFTNWENVALVNNSRLALDAAGMALGDAASGTGALSIDASSTLLAGNGVNPTIRALDPAQLVTVTNAGTIDLRNGAAQASNSLTIAGNYIGASGALRLNTVLGTDNSPSDRLVISGAGASASGSTALSVTNASGGGAATTGDGIPVVMVANGATTAPGSFALSGPVAAGAYEYMLFQGGATGGNPSNYYLRSTLLVPFVSPVPGAPPPLPQPIPLPPDVVPPSGFQIVQIIRPEVAVHSVVPDVVRTLGAAALGTFHERRGDQTLLDTAPATWGRAIGQHNKQEFSGGVRPDFSGTFAGVQAGQDFWRFDTFDGVRNFVGAQVSHIRANGNVKGFVLGVEGLPAGLIDVNATSLGGYWTMIGQSGWYVDTVVQGDFIGGTPRSFRRVGADLSGANFTASVEAGLPIPIGYRLAIEPQAQFIYQSLGLAGTRDVFSTITYANSDVLTGRIGMRLKGALGSGEQIWTPYLKADVWWRSSGAYDVSFASNTLSTRWGTGPEVEVGGGIAGRVTQAVSIYGEGSYRTATDDSVKIYKGNVGLRVAW